MVDIWDITIPEFTGEETRKLYIYLPTSYDSEQDRRYPVKRLLRCMRWKS